METVLEGLSILKEPKHAIEIACFPIVLIHFEHLRQSLHYALTVPACPHLQGRTGPLGAPGAVGREGPKGHPGRDGNSGEDGLTGRQVSQ